MALCSAVIHAARTRSSARKQETMRLLSPINARNQCVVGKTSSMCIGAAIIPIAPRSAIFVLGLAYQVRAHGPVSRTALILALQMISDAVENISDFEGALDFIEPVFLYQVAVSNVGELLSAGKEPAVRITSMWGPSNLLGFEDEQLMGAITINECLHLLYRAYSPLPRLMEEVRATLIAVCDEQPTSKAVSITGSPVGGETECQKV
jgi:hypothetical protein